MRAVPLVTYSVCRRGKRTRSLVGVLDFGVTRNITWTLLIASLLLAPVTLTAGGTRAIAFADAARLRFVLIRFRGLWLRVVLHTHLVWWFTVAFVHMPLVIVRSAKLVGVMTGILFELMLVRLIMLCMLVKRLVRSRAQRMFAIGWLFWRLWHSVSVVVVALVETSGLTMNMF